MNVFVEGLQGTGKSTLLNRLSEALPQLPVYREGDVCPVELAWCAYLTQAEFAEAKCRYPALADEMEALAVAEDDRIILPYTRVNGTGKFFAEMEGHEIYNGRISLEAFRKIILRRFSAHDGSGLFECAFLQNIVETLLLYYTLDEDQVLAFYKEIWACLKGKNARILYLDAADIAANINAARCERVDEQGNEVWFAMLMAFFSESPLAQQQGWTTSEDLLSYFRLRQRVERRILMEVVGEAAILLPEKRYDVVQVLRELQAESC